MSGSQMQMPQGMGMPQGGMPQQQGMQQRPPMQSPVPQMPQGMPQQQPQAPQQPPIVPPVVGGLAAQNPNLQLFAQAAQQRPQGQAPQGQLRLTQQEMSRMGRFGDQVMAHMAPGEIAVPPELQTPKVLATLNNAFKSVGVSPQQFTAGSQQNTQNPQTGAPEFSLLGALLPVLGAVGGSFIPGIGTAAGMALGGGLGGLAGGAIDHTGGLGMLAGAAGGAAGGYLGGSGGLGSLFGGGDTSALTSGATAAADTAAPFGDAGKAAMLTREMAGDTPAGILPAAGTVTGLPNTSPMSLMQRLMGGLYAGTGASLGSSLAPAPTQDQTPPGFNKPMDPLNRNYGQLLGSGQSNTPSFANYNPYTAVMGPNPGYRFFPT